MRLVVCVLDSADLVQSQMFGFGKILNILVP